MDAVRDIKNYILYLKKQSDLSVTLHATETESLILTGELTAFNIHDNSYCVYVKSCKQAQKHCMERQCKITEKAKDGSFVGVCYAGVKEYVYPITDNGRTVGFICVSGYKCENPKRYIEATADRFSFSEENLNAMYKCLKDDMPAKEEVDVLIMPLCAMFELAYLKLRENPEKSENPVVKIIRYLKQYHTSNITSDDICREFSYSRSYVSRKFNRYMGMSIKEYLTMLRIEDAKNLLLHSELLMTEIALSVGFCDSNYFSNVFKKMVGVSPSEYRKSGKLK